MANLINPRGFEPRRHLNGSPYNGQHLPFLIPSTDATAVFVGDIVKTAGSAGAVGVVVNGMDVEGLQTVTLATAGTTGQDIVGVVVGFLPDLSATGTLTTKHRLASTNRIVMVCTDPSVIYEVQEDAVTTPLVAADVGLNVAYTTTAGNATTGLSKMAIQSTSKATTATLPWKLLGLAKVPGNSFNTGGAAVDPARFEVIMNTGLFMPNTAGA